MKKLLSPIGSAAIAILLLLSITPEAFAIDVYHFLVQYKNGRVAEKITTHSEKAYKTFSEGYVENVVLLNKKEYSLHEFIQTFGDKNYDRFMTGCFGFGLEEQIISQRNTGGLHANPLALPSPDRKSKALEKAFAGMLNRDDQKPKINYLKRPLSPNADSLQPKGADSDFPVDWSLQKGGIDLAADLRQKSPQEADDKEGFGPKIQIYRFLAEFINGRTVEKVSAQLPETYCRQFKGYVRRAALTGRETYTMREFKKTFGEKSCHLLIQGLFGKDDTDLVMENRIKRGLAPDPGVLPAPSKTADKLAKQLNRLIANQ